MTVPETVVFLHAHPDDESIFTGGTIARLVQIGHRAVLVVATGGELGEASAPVRDEAGLGLRRREETRRAAALLGVARVEFLHYRDSGMAGSPDNDAPGAFAQADTEQAARRVAELLAEEQASAIVAYDEHGIYGHPDHVKVHEVGVLAARYAGVATVYLATVDREYLHFVETHLVVEAGGRPGDLGLARSTLGVPTVAVTTMVDVRPVLDVKRRAMAAHSSQISEATSAMSLPAAAFSAVYGFEWYVRDGPRGPLDDLA